MSLSDFSTAAIVLGGADVRAELMQWHGWLMTSFQLMGGLHFSMELEGYPDVGETNAFLEGMKGKKIRMTIEEV